MRPAWIGTELVVGAERINLIVEALFKHTSAITDESESYIEIHNAFTAYSVMLLFAATGYRPVRDPFCYRVDYCLDLGMMLIDDKVVSERHRYRLVALPEIAIAQLANYEKHLKWLVSKLIVDPKSNGLENAAYQVTNTHISRKLHSLPLFFFLKATKNKIRTISISESTLSEELGELWPLPYNFSRRNIATQLRNMCISQQVENLSVDVIEAHLGHLEGINHPFGNSSVLSPIDYRQQLVSPLNGLLLSQKWKQLKSKRHFRNLDNLHTANWRHSKKILGPVERENKRKSSKSNDKDIVNGALSKYSDDEIIAQPELVNSIRQVVISKSENDEERLNVRLLLLWKKLVALKARKPDLILPRRLHIIRTESSPFNAFTLSSYKVAKDLRQNFINYLQNEGNKYSKISGKKLNYYRRVSEILVSAALFDGMCNRERLETLSDTKFYLTQEGSVIYMDILHPTSRKKNNLMWRWLPQPLSIALVIGLDSKLVSNSRMSYFNKDRFLMDLVELLISLGISRINSQNVFNKLAEISQSYWIMHLPPFLREIAKGSLSVQPLKETALVRILRGERLNKEETTDRSIKKDKIKVIAYAVITRQDSHYLKNARLFLKDIKSNIKQAEKEKGKNKKSASYIRKETLKASLHLRLSHNHHYPSIAVAIGSWCIKLCTEGTDLFGEVGFSTVKEYTYMVSKSLVEIASTYHFFNLDPEQYDYIYDVAIEVNKFSDKTKFLNNIKDFHNFLVSSGLAPSIDWAQKAQGVYQDRVLASVDANIITANEYRKAIKILYMAGESDQMDKRLSMHYCALLFLGYHFGLRISESFHLQYRHIQHNKDWTCMVIHVANTLFGDTKSNAGRRQIPLLENLTELEKKIVKVVFNQHVSINNDEITLVFSLVNRTGELINMVETSQVLNSVLKQVTGDPNAHYHLLRHSFYSRVYPQLFNIDDNGFGDYIEKLSEPYLVESNMVRSMLTGRENISFKILKALSICAGHSQSATTFSHYIHTADHHLHHCLNKIELWGGLSFERIDHITAYAHLDNFEKMKKRRVRRSIGADNLLGAFTATILYSKFPKAKNETVCHPEYEEIYMDTKDSDRKITLTDIDKVLLLFCTFEKPEIDDISERLFLHKDRVRSIVDNFIEKKCLFNYLGYNSINEITQKKSSDIETESVADTVSIHRKLTKIDKLLCKMGKKDFNVVIKGISAWSQAYYPNKRYKPLVFCTPDDVVNFLDAMNILCIDSLQMMVTAPENKTSWYELDDSCTKLEIHLKGDRHIFEFNRGNIVQHIPLPLSQVRVTTKKRISISIDKSSKSSIAYQKRFHRICFLIYLYMLI